MNCAEKLFNRRQQKHEENTHNQASYDGHYSTGVMKIIV